MCTNRIMCLTIGGEKGGMIMQALQSSEVRKNFSRFIDSVVRERPAAFKRNRDYIISFSKEQLLDLLSDITFTAEFFPEDDGTVTAALKEIDIAANADSKEAALEALAGDLIEYAEEYLNELPLYKNSPNRKKHFPFVLKAALQNTLEDVKNLINAQFE